MRMDGWFVSLQWRCCWDTDVCFQHPCCKVVRLVCLALYVPGCQILTRSFVWELQVNYINAHATSTLVGDIAEVKAIKNVFSDTTHIKMNGTKSMIGHCLGAAAGIEAVATIKAIQTGWVHPTINQVRPCLCPACWLNVQGTCRP